MATGLLTDIVAKSAKATPGRQYTVWDSALRGFGLRIGSEVKAWTVMVGKDRRRITIGRYPTMGLQAARLEAKRLILAASIARNQPQITVVPFSAALDEFVELRLPQNRPNTARERERVLRKHFEPVWKAKLLTEITRTDVNRVLDGIVHKAPIMANNAFATIRLFLRWAIQRGYLANSPCEALQSPAKGQKYTLLSRRENLTLEGRRALKTLLAANKRLNTAYLLKESFGQLWDYQREGWARRFFDNWRASLKWQRLEPYQKFAGMIDRHWDGIAAYCRPENKVSLGFVEGLNNKIRVLQRRAYGLCDEEYLRLKVLTCMLPPL